MNYWDNGEVFLACDVLIKFKKHLVIVLAGKLSRKTVEGQTFSLKGTIYAMKNRLTGLLKLNATLSS